MAKTNHDKKEIVKILKRLRIDQSKIYYKYKNEIINNDKTNIDIIHNKIINVLHNVLNNNVDIEIAMSSIGTLIGLIGKKFQSIWSLNKVFYYTYWIHVILFTVLKTSLSQYIKNNYLRYVYHHHPLTSNKTSI